MERFLEGGKIVVIRERKIDKALIEKDRVVKPA
jgi:hypothetical protein